MNGITAAFTGRVTSDPEPRYLPGGKALLTFSVAVDQSYTATEAKPAPEPLHVKVTCWEALAEALTERLKKGRVVCCLHYRV